MTFWVPFSLEGDDYDTQIDEASPSKDYRRMVTWCRDAVVRIFRLDWLYEEIKIEPVELVSHTISCTSACVSPNERYLVTGGRDYKTVLWDLTDIVLNSGLDSDSKTKFKPISECEIERNMVTFMKWHPNDGTKFIQTSEDLNIRIFSVENSILEQLITVSMGDNFATNFDIDISGKSLK